MHMLKQRHPAAEGGKAKNSSRCGPNLWHSVEVSPSWRHSTQGPLQGGKRGTAGAAGAYEHMGEMGRVEPGVLGKYPLCKICSRP